MMTAAGAVADVGRAEVWTMADVSVRDGAPAPVAVVLAILAMREALHAAYGVDCSYVVLGRGEILAASNAKDGKVDPRRRAEAADVTAASLCTHEADAAGVSAGRAASGRYLPCTVVAVSPDGQRTQVLYAGGLSPVFVPTSWVRRS